MAAARAGRTSRGAGRRRLSSTSSSSTRSTRSITVRRRGQWRHQASWSLWRATTHLAARLRVQTRWPWTARRNRRARRQCPETLRRRHQTGPPPRLRGGTIRTRPRRQDSQVPPWRRGARTNQRRRPRQGSLRPLAQPLSPPNAPLLCKAASPRLPGRRPRAASVPTPSPAALEQTRRAARWAPTALLRALVPASPLAALPRRPRPRPRPRPQPGSPAGPPWRLLARRPVPCTASSDGSPSSPTPPRWPRRLLCRRRSRRRPRRPRRLERLTADFPPLAGQVPTRAASLARRVASSGRSLEAA